MVVSVNSKEIYYLKNNLTSQLNCRNLEIKKQGKMEAGAASENLPSLMDIGQEPQNAAPSNSDGKGNTEAIPPLMDLGKLPQTAASNSPDGKTKDEIIPSLMEFGKPSQATKSDKDDGKSTSESLPSLLDLDVTKQGSYDKTSKDKVEEDLKSVIYSRSLKIDLDNKMKRQLKYRNRQMKPRPPVNEEDKRFDFFKMDPEPFAALKFHVRFNFVLTTPNK